MSDNFLHLRPKGQAANLIIVSWFYAANTVILREMYPRFKALAAEWQMGRIVVGSKVVTWMCLSPFLARRECSLIQASHSGIH